MTEYSNGEKFRAEMVDAARKFFSSPRIKNTPFEEKKRYLLGRGITEEEISEAMKIGSCGNEESDSQMVNDNFVMDDIPFNESLASNNRLMQFVNISILLGGLSYMGYHFLRSYLIPTFFKIRDATEDHSDRIQQLQTKVISCLNFLHVFNFYLIRFLIR
ncbi:unnamed protein product [Dracunculus medinensis]|uniref:Pex14_N domain-containing protein n=1 Tax=Dracunculus medinensis TaxID=318479 RepID=A0A0N4UPL0_DRAME|nr:unnamed protein product [Dracunculus medinensis]